MLTVRDLSWRRFAELTGYHPSWLSKIKHGASPSADLVRRCDQVLNANGVLIALATKKTTGRMAQLPVPLAGFVGREHELARMQTVLTREPRLDVSRTVFLEGPPGVGKTSTAIRSAYEVQGAEHRTYPDGELHINLHGFSSEGRPVNAADALQEFLVELGVPLQDIPNHTEPRAKLYRSVLASRRVLIILDNAASADQIELLLPGSRHCGVIVTSRKTFAGLAMRVGAERVVLGPVTRSEAVTILSQAVRTDVSSAQIDHLVTLADQCGRLPLALRISTERLAVHPHRPIAEMIDELAAEHERLDGLSTGQSNAIRTVFEWSYNDLSPDEKRMFRRLSLHPGQCFSAGAVSALEDVPMVQARRLLEKLTSVHLLEQTTDDRYQFHDLLRVYAAERRTETDGAAELNAARLRLVKWYQDNALAAGRALTPFRPNPLELSSTPGYSQRPFPDVATALRWCDGEAENFVSIVKMAADQGFHGVAWKTAVALFDYLRLLRNPGRLGLTTTSAALKAARASADRYAESWVETTSRELPLAAPERWCPPARPRKLS